MKIVFLLLFGLNFSSFFAQLQVDTVRYNSGWQKMFNATNDPNPYTVNEYFGLPTSGPISWDEGFTWNAPGFSTGSLDLGPFGSFAGFGFGASFWLTTDGYFGIGLSIHDFVGDSLLVNYPTKITTNFPANNSFFVGDWVGIKTDYTVIDETTNSDSAYIDSRYPKGGSVDFDMGANANAHVGASITVDPFGTLSYDFLSLEIGLPTINLFHVNEDTSYYYGEANLFAVPSIPNGSGGWTFPSAGPDPTISAIPGYPGGYPDIAFPACGGAQALIPGACTIAQIWTPDLPIEGSLGLVDGSFSLPYINLKPTTVLPSKNLIARGDSTYISIEMDLFKALSSLIAMTCGSGRASKQPPQTPNPYCVAAELVLGNLSNSIEQGIPGLDEDLEIWYNIISARFELTVTNKQRFEFKPKVKGKMQLPTPVQYKIVSQSGLVSPIAIGNVINYTVGDSIYIKSPCFYDEFKIKRSFSMDGKMNSKTYDSLDFAFVFDGLGFGLKIPGFTILDSYSWSFCIPYGYPCGDVFWPSWCSGEWCETISTPYIGFPSIDWSTCDLGGPYAGSSPPPSGTCSIEFINESLGAFNIIWREKEWGFQGFDPIYPADTIVLLGRKMSVSAVAVDALCFGGFGTINVTVVNGKLPFSVSWDNGPSSTVNSNTFTSPNLLTGNHVAQITDANGCIIFAGDVVGEPGAALNVIPTIVNDNCNDLTGNGSISILPSGGTMPYTYLWSGTGSTAGYNSSLQNISNLLPGQYNLTISDSHGCVNNTTHIVNQPNPLIASVVSNNPVNCFGEATGSINIALSGGTVPYQTVWKSLPSNSTISTSNNLIDVFAGDYTLTVTDTSMCSITNTYTINQPAQLVLTSNISDVLCNGGNSGNVVGTVTGGVPGYTYHWYNGANVLLSSTTNVLSNAYADDYNLEVFDSKGCMINLVSPVVQPDIVAVSNSTLQNVNCYGNSTGSIQIDVIGGVTPYTYDWSNDGFGAYDDTEDLIGLSAGTYTVKIKDANNCIKTFTYVITEPAAALSAVPTLTHVKCYGNSTGSILVNVEGGTMPYTFDWDTDGTGDFDDPQNLLNIPAGVYTLTVKDTLGCTTTFTSQIFQPAAPLSLTETHANVLCFAGNSGSININLAGGTVPYTFTWSNGSSILMTQTTPNLTNLTSDSYTVLVQDANDCTISTTIFIDQPSAPLAISTSIIEVDCYNSSTGSIDLTVTGGTGPFIYDWDNDGVGDNDDFQDLLNIPSTNYAIIVYDNNGCTITSSYFVDQPQAPIQLSVTSVEASCFGEATGSISLTTIGGTAPYTIDWDNDGTGDFDDPQNLINIPSGVYIVNVMDTNGCLETIGGFVAQPAAALDVIATIIDPSCYAYSDGSVNLAITGGTTPYYMQWGDTNEYLLNNPSELLSELTTGNYFLRVRDVNNCVFEQFVFVDQPDTLSVTNIITDVSCFEGSDGAINLTSNGGTTPYSYIWSNGSNNEDQFNLVTDIYGYILTDAQGCIYKEELIVYQPPEIQIASEINGITCVDQKDASIYIQTAGGTQPYNWIWSNGETTNHITDLSIGLYELTISDYNGCIKKYDFIIDSSSIECLILVNTFTPNGDDYNDTWVIGNIHLYPKAEVKVFNRWGNLLFESQGEYIPWDGVFNGSKLPSEVYYYVIVLNNDENNKYTGTITIVR
jgi:gliding motility-associated-like protein